MLAAVALLAVSAVAHMQWPGVSAGGLTFELALPAALGDPDPATRRAAKQQLLLMMRAGVDAIGSPEDNGTVDEQSRDFLDSLRRQIDERLGQ